MMQVQPEIIGQPQRKKSLLSAPDVTKQDIRIVCNVLKRSSSLAAAAICSRSSTVELVNAADKMTIALLKAAGASEDVRSEGHYAYSVTMEAVSLTIEALSTSVQGRALLATELAQTTEDAVRVFIELIKSKPVKRIADDAWSHEVDPAAAFRLAICTAMTPFSVLLEEYSFEQPKKQCLQEAAKLVAKTAVEATKRIATADTTQLAYSILQQSMLNSCAKIFLSLWRLESSKKLDELSRIGPIAASAERARLAGASVAMVLNDFSKKLASNFETLIEVTLEIAPLEGSNFVPTRDLGVSETPTTIHRHVPDLTTEMKKPWKRDWLK